MNVGNVAQLQTRPETKIWYRAIQPQHWASSLKTSQSRGISSRFNIGAAAKPQYSVLYLAENPVVALFEAQAIFGSTISPPGIIAHPRRAFITINVQVQLARIVDLSDPTNQAVIDTTAQELTGDWRGYHTRSQHTSVSRPLAPAPTQELGAALHAQRYLEGFLTVSAKLPTYQTLVVFPQNLGKNSFISFEHFATGVKTRIDRDNLDGIADAGS